MLVGLLNSQRIPAWEAEKGQDYFCPNCGDALTLKKGRRVIHHFAHQPPTNCDWSSGESREHMMAKQQLASSFRLRGFLTEVEAPVLSIAGDRRADVLLTNAAGKRAALEVQHTSISEDAIERRTNAYIQANVPVTWLGILGKNMQSDMEVRPGGGLIRKFTPRPWHRWAHAFGYKNIWFVDPDNGRLWSGEMRPYMIEVQSSSWYNEYGEEQSAGGFTRYSKKWKELWLSGPFDASEIEVTTPYRKAWKGGKMNLPAGRFLKLNKPTANTINPHPH